MRNRVFVLTSEPYHDNSEVLGVYRTEEAARVAAAVHFGKGRDLGDTIEWESTSALGNMVAGCTTGWVTNAAGVRRYGDDYLITEMEVRDA
jgi:hypothetical protein